MIVMNEGRILIIDDNEDVLFSLKLLLEPYLEQVHTSPEPEQILNLMDQVNPYVILLDMNYRSDAISGGEGMALLKLVIEKDPQAVVILMTAYGDTDKAVKAIKAGATDFISKPWENDRLVATIHSAIELSKSRHQVQKLQDKVEMLNQQASGESDEEPILIGECESMIQLRRTIERLKDTEANIMILGENGTGKDVIAHLIRYYSPRRNEQFVSIDLGSVPETLFEGELFGYEKGAFTDAKSSKAGRMETASGGTLFLDEIGNLSLPMQAKLLTALEKRKIQRLGSTKVTDIDVRLITATNADISKMVETGQFRQDLLYRINTIELNLPPLRERGKDIILLANHFLKVYSQKYKKAITGIEADAQQKLLLYSWPGNVRELQHVIERAVILSTSDKLQTVDFMLTPQVGTGQNGKSEGKLPSLNLEELELRAIDEAMKQTGGNISLAAQLLGITRFALYRKLKKE